MGSIDLIQVWLEEGDEVVVRERNEAQQEAEQNVQDENAELELLNELPDDLKEIELFPVGENIFDVYLKEIDINELTFDPPKPKRKKRKSYGWTRKPKSKRNSKANFGKISFRKKPTPRTTIVPRPWKRVPTPPTRWSTRIRRQPDWLIYYSHKF